MGDGSAKWHPRLMGLLRFAYAFCLARDERESQIVLVPYAHKTGRDWLSRSWIVLVLTANLTDVKKEWFYLRHFLTARRMGPSPQLRAGMGASLQSGLCSVRFQYGGEMELIRLEIWVGRVG